MSLEDGLCEYLVMLEMNLPIRFGTLLEFLPVSFQSYATTSDDPTIFDEFDTK